MSLALLQAVTWVRVPPPTFDLVGVVLGALAGAFFLAMTALFVGGVLGSALVYRRRHEEHAAAPQGLLGLLER